MAHKTQDLDLVFQALADPTRRAVFDALAQGPESIADLAAPHRMALPSFTKHIAMLEKAGLIRSVKKGRSRICTRRADRLKLVDRWLEAQRGVATDQTEELIAVARSLYPERSSTRP